MIPVVLWALAGAASAAPEAERPLYYDREITPADLEGRSLRELEILRGTIFARALLPIRTPWLHEHFAREGWYKTVPVAESLLRRKLTPIDKKNATIIAAYQAGLSREELLKRREALPKTPELVASVTQVALSPDGQLGLVAEAGGAVRLWQLPSGQVVRTLAEPGRPVAFAAGFFPDGNRAWTLQEDNKFIFWDVKTGKAQRTLPIMSAPGPGRRAAVQPDGKRLAVADSALLRTWDLNTGKEVWKVPTTNDAVQALTYTVDSKFLFVASTQGLVERDAALGYEQLKLPAQSQLPMLSAVAVSANGKRAVLGGSGWLASLEFESGRMSATAEVRPEASKEEKFHVFLRPDGKTMLAGAQPGRLWLAEEGKPEPLWQRRLSATPVAERFAVALSADGKRILVGSPDSKATGWDVELWEADTGQTVAAWTGAAEVQLERRLIARALGEKSEGATNPLDDLSMLDQPLTADQLKALSLHELRLLRSTIQARRGRSFKSEPLRNYFGRMEWYKPNPAYRDTLLTAVDKQNLKLVQSAEQAIVSRGGPKALPTDESWFSESD
jgi:WD40 repeat protein